MTRKLIEAQLIEEHHWTPQQIDQIPHKRLTEYLLINKYKSIFRDVRVRAKSAVNALSAMGSGKMRKFIREV